MLVFFALSGLVLAFSFIKVDRERYAPYPLKRFTRIWPPVAAAILVAVVLKALQTAQPVQLLSTWFDTSWDEPSTFKSLLGTLVMSGKTITLDNPMWSLIHEARISVIIPLLALVTIRRPIVAITASITLMLLAVRVNGNVAGHPVLHSAAMSLAFIFLFALGIMIAANLARVRRALGQLRPLQTAALWLLALTAIAFPPRARSRSRALRSLSCC